MAKQTQPSSGTPVLPHPREPLNPAVEPFVGNASVDDNIDESAHLALWKVLGTDHTAVEPSTSGGVVTLTGIVATPELRTRAEEAVKHVRGARYVVNHIVLGQPTASALSNPGGAAVETIAPRPMVQLVRYCSLDEASLSAALRQAVEILDAFLETHGQPSVAELIVVYRNRRHDTLTMEIGVPVNAEIAAAANGELHAADAPHGSFIGREVEPGLPSLLAAETALIRAADIGVGTQPYFWQSFAPVHFRPWQGHPASKVYLPVLTPETK